MQHLQEPLQSQLKAAPIVLNSNPVLFPDSAKNMPSLNGLSTCLAMSTLLKNTYKRTKPTPNN